MYLSSNAHPEIQFILHQCDWFSHVPWSSHEEAIKHICWYLQGVKGNRLAFHPNTRLELDLYVNADFAGFWNYKDDQDSVFVKYRTGYVFALGGCPIICSSKLKTEISLRTTKSEYIAITQAMWEIIPVRRLLLEKSMAIKIGVGESSVIKSTVFG